ncbi:MAG TPA: hypothetical protein VFE13_07220, partial [Caulobacteraceae bacterium]|jgi:autotransporter passenger strand-loop-strand repeat protein|nr:hypothetical protein [Caulobacteraceae bacterium]
VSGSLLQLKSGAVASETFLESGGTEVVSSGGVDIAGRIFSGGVQTISAGSALSGTISAGGQVVVLSGGKATAETISSGGLELVQAGGFAALGRVSSGGVLRVSSGGAASGAVVRLGGIETVAAGGTATATHLFGKEFVFGRTSHTSVGSGGREFVAAGGAAVGAVVSKGGTLLVSAGGAVSGGLTLSGGNAVISGTMAAGQAVKFAGSGVLELDNLPGFAAKISGLSAPAEKIDLGGFAFGAGETRTWTQSGGSGTLVVRDGGKTATLTLIGAYATSDFHLANDGHGGTYVADHGPAPATPSRLAQAAAVLGGVLSDRGGGASHRPIAPATHGSQQPLPAVSAGR